MTPAQFKALKTGDLVRGRFSGAAFVVTQSHGDRVTAVRTQDLSNPDEWDLVDRDGTVNADAPAPPAPAVPSNPEKLLEVVSEAVAEALGDAYDCTRVWSAWSYGTMGPDDFSLVREDQSRVAEIADAVMKAMKAAEPAPVVPEGWKPVPMKPTEMMCWAGCEVSQAPTVPVEVWNAMLAAAPEVVAKGVEP